MRTVRLDVAKIVEDIDAAARRAKDEKAERADPKIVQLKKRTRKDHAREDEQILHPFLRTHFDEKAAKIPPKRPRKRLADLKRFHDSAGSALFAELSRSLRSLAWPPTVRTSNDAL